MEFIFHDHLSQLPFFQKVTFRPTTKKIKGEMIASTELVDGRRNFILKAEAKIPFQPAFKYQLTSTWNTDREIPFLETYSQWSEKKGEEVLRRNNHNEIFTYEASKPGKISVSEPFSAMPKSQNFVDPLSVVFGLQLLTEDHWNTEMISFSSPGEMRLKFGPQQIKQVACFEKPREMQTIEMEVNGKSLGDRFQLYMDSETRLICSIGYQLPVLGMIGIEASEYEIR